MFDNGLEYIRADFHLHTKKDKEFKGEEVKPAETAIAQTLSTPLDNSSLANPDNLNALEEDLNSNLQNIAEVNTINQTSFTTVKCKEYFPLYLYFDTSIENIEHIGFYYNDTDLLEFTVDNKNKAIRKIVLSLNHHYIILNDKIDFPADYVDCGVALSMHSHIDCNMFLTTVFQDGITFTFSTNTIVESYRMDKVIFSVDSDGNLVKIFITDLTGEQIDHTIKELEYN